MFDFDFPVRIYPSTTPGHFHVYLEKELTWPQYKDVLEAMQRAGLIQPGYAEASKRRKQAFLRLPWIKKPAPAAPADDDLLDGMPF